MADRSVIPLLDAVKSKLMAIRSRHIKYTLSTDAIHEQLSIEYTEIPMKKPSRYAVVYYAGECVYAYKKMLQLYQKCVDHKLMEMTSVADELELYVTGWSSGKVITPKNMEWLQGLVDLRGKIVQEFQDQMKELRQNFDSLNQHDDTEMVDHVELSLYKKTDKFPYRRAYRHFFKREMVNDTLVEAHIKTDTDILDRLLRLMNVLYMGWNRVGKGEEYEIWRKKQRQLILLIEEFGTVLDHDIDLYESFLRLNETVIAFKVYPWTKDFEPETGAHP